MKKNLTILQNIESLETIYKITELYIWLANRFEGMFVDKKIAENHLKK